MSTVVALPLLLAASGTPYPGEVFPAFDSAQRCQFMAASTHPRIRNMATVCADRESEYRQLAKNLWDMTEESNRWECDLSAMTALGSYEVLSDCLRDQMVLNGAAE